jgi:hypothetical protein
MALLQGHEVAGFVVGLSVVPIVEQADKGDEGHQLSVDVRRPCEDVAVTYILSPCSSRRSVVGFVACSHSACSC